MSETDVMKEIDTKPAVMEIPALGFGNSESAISRDKQLASGELSVKTENAAAEIIIAGECMVKVTEKDDGCIDGRIAVAVTYIDRDGELRESIITLDDRHERAKVAGGGYVTSLAMQLALHPPAEGIDTILRSVVATLADKGIYCGLHSGDHQQNETTDCGANDKVDAILQTAGRYSVEIARTSEVLISLAGANYSESAQQLIIENWSLATDAPHVFAQSNGKTRAHTIFDTLRTIQDRNQSERPVAVSKHLANDHKEDFIIVNYRKNETFSQAKLRDKLSQQFPELPDSELPQAFVVDAWRIIELAVAMTDDETEQQVMIQAGVSYQLATAATLTDGSLRVFAIR